MSGKHKKDANKEYDEVRREEKLEEEKLLHSENGTTSEALKPLPMITN
jgi:hypothetical protein